MQGGRGPSGWGTKGESWGRLSGRGGSGEVGVGVGERVRVGVGVGVGVRVRGAVPASGTQLQAPGTPCRYP